LIGAALSAAVTPVARVPVTMIAAPSVAEAACGSLVWARTAIGDEIATTMAARETKLLQFMNSPLASNEESLSRPIFSYFPLFIFFPFLG